MLQSKRTRRVVAATLLAVMLSNTFAPTVTYALTNGPTAPEATSFEPVDTTDMVNLQTGDFTYNMPLMEVPGPEGGYPLSLSYHAGIQPNEEASWVGLGWTLNPGAISRSVNGYPDDWYNPAGSNRNYWVGGTTTTYSMGVSIGLANTPATVNFGLAFSQDTYRGFGVSFYSSADLKGSLGPLQFGIGSSPNGPRGYVGVGVQAIIAGLNTSASVGMSTNFAGDASFSAKTALGFGNSLASLGASISTGSSKPSLSIGGLAASVSSTNSAGIQTSNSSFGLDVPLFAGLSVSLGYSKVRYWTDETTSVTTHGSLYSSGWPIDDNTSNTAYDGYSLLESPDDKDLITYSDPAKVLGGAYLDFDVYNVNAQGLGGSMRPYLFQGEVLGQNFKNQNGNPLITYYSPGSDNLKPAFRFEGDFSNSYRQTYPDWPDVFGNPATMGVPTGAAVYGNNDNTFGYNTTTGALAGSRHIDVGVKILPSNIKGYVKTDRFQANMIDGFSITNESGVTYHFGLPAYSWGEENYQEKIARQNGVVSAFTRSTKSTPYAYTWYLTTITGPDFVDRNGDQKAGEGDWGYWINFEYGKWSNSYIWRNPSEGYQKDEDNDWQNCSMGYKEVYYLNAIRSRTHVAFFEKELRKDSKGASSAIFDKNTNNGASTDYVNQGSFGMSSAQSLRLSRIYLMNTTDAESLSIPTPSSGGANAYDYQRTPTCTACQLTENVLELSDIQTSGRAALEAKALRVIDFVHDYSSSPKTVNSFDSYYLPNEKYGKLTLTSLNFRGKGGMSYMPPTKFVYELSPEDITSASGVTLTPTSFTTTNGSFEVGDLIVSNGIYCGIITNKPLPSGGTYTYTLANGLYSGGTITTSVQTTKNPPYNKDAYDSWGMFKGDYDLTRINTSDNLGRASSGASARAADAWSLRKIVSALGSEVKINYESDMYKKSILGTDFPFVMTGITVDADKKTLHFQVPDNGSAAEPLLKSGDKCKPILYVSYYNALVYYKYTVEDNVVGDLTINSVSGANITGVLDQPIPAQAIAGAVTYSYNNILSGNIGVPQANNFYGGGLRVASISLNNSFKSYTTTTRYNYTNGSNSSGVTSYLPNTMSSYDRSALAVDNSGVLYYQQQQCIDKYKSRLFKGMSSLLAISREIPPPGVMYEYVGITSEVKNSDEPNARQIEGKTQYQFEVFRDNMIYRGDVSSRQTATGIDARNLAIKKFTGSIGNLKSVVQYDINAHKLSETVTHYLHDGLEGLTPDQFMQQYKARLVQYSYQGYLQERYSQVKRLNNQTTTSDNGVKMIMSAREEYPCISTGQTVFNYVTNTQTASENAAFDFYSGAVTKTVETDAYGNRFMTEAIPAYTKYSAMGLKINNGANTNMLTQTAAAYTYKVDGNNQKLGLVSANVTNWSNQTPVVYADYYQLVQDGNNNNGNVWRMQSSYSWMPDTKSSDGLTAMNNFTDFNWSSPGASHANWKKTSEITSYDVYSNVMEAKNINGNFVSTHMTYNSLKVQLTGSPAKYSEIAYTGAEGVDDMIEYGFSMDEAYWNDDPAFAHTGTGSFGSAPGSEAFYYTMSADKLVAGRDYYASIWVKPATGTASDVKLYYSIDGVQKGIASSVNSGKTAGGWTLVTLPINGSDIVAGSSLKVGCRNDHSVDVYIDDMLFRPLNATTTAYVYDAFSGEVSFILDKNGLYSKYEYDAGGRLLKTYREKLNTGVFQTNEYEYNYSATKYYSNAINRYIWKNDCYPTMGGTATMINVPAGKYFSYVPGEASAQAEAYAQKEANRLGSCVTPTVYVRLEMGDYVIANDGCITTERTPARLKFYSDPNGTIPLSVSGVIVNIGHSYFVNGANLGGSYSITCSGTVTLVDADTYTYYDDICGTTMITEAYSINSGTGYTVLPSF